MNFFNAEQVETLLPMPECIAVMRDLFSLNLAEETFNPLRNILSLPGVAGILGLMPAYIKPYQVMGVKVLSVFLENYKKGLSSHQGLVNLFETETGQFLAGFDADSLTAIRTAAVSALVTDLLAADDAENLCLLGSGRQAEKHLEAVLAVRPVKQVTVWSQNYAHAQAFVERAALVHPVLNIRACSSAEEAVQIADIVCTVTSSPTPVVFNDWLKPGVHINAVGACSKDKRELDGEIIRQSDVYVDSYESAVNEAGDLLLAADEELLVTQIIKADIHEVLTEKVSVDKNKKTVFKSLGLAIEDVAAARYCWMKANNLAL